MPPDPPSRHAHLSHATIILLPSCPPQLKILYETLKLDTFSFVLCPLASVRFLVTAGFYFLPFPPVIDCDDVAMVM